MRVFLLHSEVKRRVFIIYFQFKYADICLYVSRDGLAVR